jgi:hypothetical protein
MRFFRYRRPSLKTMLGITKAKKRIKRTLGITAITRPFRWWTNAKRRFKRRIGYESTLGRLVRHGLPRPAGCSITTLAVVLAIMAAILAVAWRLH